MVPHVRMMMIPAKIGAPETSSVILDHCDAASPSPALLPPIDGPLPAAPLAPAALAGAPAGGGGACEAGCGAVHS
eukprot:scaffold263_cov120-Isochrysis_galbana.AAC.24